jgi:polysaccharide export outer membrane protein
MSRLHSFLRAGSFVLALSSALGQPAAPPPAPSPAAAVSPASPGQAVRPDAGPAGIYLISPDDVLIIRALNAEELSDKPFRVEADGFLTLPLLGRIKAAGLTVEQLEAAVTDALKPLIKEPQVAVSVVERAKTVSRQQSIAVVGAFRSPGFYPVLGKETVMDVLARTGGLLPNASRRLRLTRRADQGPIPLPNALVDPGNKTSTVEIALTPNLEPINAADNVELKAFDTLSAVKLEQVYATGELGRTGAFPLEDRESYSVAQLVSLAGGLGPSADGKKAHVLRQVLNTSRRSQIPIDLKAVLSGQATDMPLLPNDILVVPKSGGKRTMAGRIAMYSIGPLITSLIYLALR